MNTPALTSALIVTGLGLILAIDGLVPAPPRPGAPLSPCLLYTSPSPRD